jgi:hypothetical protein
VTVSHDALLDAVHVHPVGACMAKLEDPPDIAALADPGESVNAQEMPASVTVKVLPPIVTVPVRELLPVLAATLSCTVPLPEPVAPEVTLIHEALLVADQLHPLVAVTPTLAEPPVEARLVDVDERL